MITDIMTHQDNTKANSMTIISYLIEFIRYHVGNFFNIFLFFSFEYLNLLGQSCHITDKYFCIMTASIRCIAVLVSFTRTQINLTQVHLLIYFCGHVISSKNVQSAHH